jgi:hypothetical protein
VVSSRSYKGHESDVDITHFVNVYRNTVGSRLDDCQTCHTGGSFTSASNSRVTTKNPCDFCHLIQHPQNGYVEPMPTTYRQTLNPYGVAYMDGGRSRQALQAIASQDSDGDGSTNEVEIADLKYPGDSASKPGQQTIPLRMFTLSQLKALTQHEQFLLANTSRQQFDFYATYAGVKVRDLLVAAGVNPDDPGITGLTVVAPDGFLQDVDMSAVNAAFPQGLFHGGLDTATLGDTCGFVQYPSPLPEGLTSGAAIPGAPWLQLAHERDGLALDPVSLDVTVGKIDGEGPYRLVVPQADPGPPDRGAQHSPTTCGDTYDYDQSKDHNAGAMVRGVVAIRVNPLPEGYEDFDYRNGGWAFVEGVSVAVYGRGVTMP